ALAKTRSLTVAALAKTRSLTVAALAKTRSLTVAALTIFPAGGIWGSYFVALPKPQVEEGSELQRRQERLLPLGPVLGFRLLEVMHVLVQSLHVVMVRPLRFAVAVLVADDRHPVLAQRAVHVAGAVQRFLGSLQERLHQQRVHLQVRHTDVVEVRRGLA